MIALFAMWLGGLLMWLCMWAGLWSETPPERFDPRAIVVLFAVGVLWPLALVLGLGATALDAWVNRA